jgi:hypothetical protein
VRTALSAFQSTPLVAALVVASDDSGAVAPAVANVDLPVRQRGTSWTEPDTLMDSPVLDPSDPENVRETLSAFQKLSSTESQHTSTNRKEE